ncbi:hypothetical protein BC938DRAFT_484056 [Jimgerdemannia flammicorona]|uniref:Uncharacterized protein n=1 Tax=Jimgerdemannia flammicorona TaxID=994334 RepID=A0A433QAK8_9FUNG|nr:hypothetical protein BC938DRAFT_484056 [Jimgerdemannia flammicorona]
MHSVNVPHSIACDTLTCRQVDCPPTYAGCSNVFANLYFNNQAGGDIIAELITEFAIATPCLCSHDICNCGSGV